MKKNKNKKPEVVKDVKETMYIDDDIISYVEKRKTECGDEVICNICGGVIWKIGVIYKCGDCRRIIENLYEN